MTDKELKRLSRSDLLEMLIDQMKQNDQLHEQIDSQTKELEERNIKIENAGSIAEASLALNGVFEAADAAAKQYLESVKALNGEQDNIIQNKINEAQTQADEILADAQKQADDMIANAQTECDKRKQEADEYWNQISKKLEKFNKDYQKFKELLAQKKENDKTTG